MSKSHCLTALSKSGDRLHRLAKGVTDQPEHVDTGFEPPREQRGAADLALDEQVVGRGNVPRSLVARDRRSFVAQRADKAPVAEVEWSRAMHYGNDHVDHPVDPIAMPVDRALPDEARRHRRYIGGVTPSLPIATNLAPRASAACTTNSFWPFASTDRVVGSNRTIGVPTGTSTFAVPPL